MNAIILAALLTLAPGDNPAPEAYGQVAAVQATTQAASASVTVSAVSLAQTWTNVYEDVVSAHRRYDFTITNWDGNASIATNTLDVFNYADWMLGPTNMIVGPVVPSDVLMTNTVATGKALAAQYFVTNTLATVSASGHYGTATPDAAFVFGGTLVVTGAADGDIIKIIIK